MTYDITDHDKAVLGSEYTVVRVPEIFSMLIHQPSNMLNHQFKSGHMTRLSPVHFNQPSYQDGKAAGIAATVGYLIVLGHMNGPIDGCWYSGDPKSASAFYESLVNLIYKGGKIKPFAIHYNGASHAEYYAVRDEHNQVVYEEDGGSDDDA